MKNYIVKFNIELKMVPLPNKKRSIIFPKFELFKDLFVKKMSKSCTSKFSLKSILNNLKISPSITCFHWYFFITSRFEFEQPFQKAMFIDQLSSNIKIFKNLSKSFTTLFMLCSYPTKMKKLSLMH